jgi:hypothetical protein
MISLWLLACTKPEPSDPPGLGDTAAPADGGPCDSWTGLALGRTHTYELAGVGYRATNVSTVVSIDAEGNVLRTAAVEGESYDEPYTAEVEETGSCDAQGFSMSRRYALYSDGYEIDTLYDPPLVWFWADVAIGREWTQDSTVTTTDSGGTFESRAEATAIVAGQDTFASPLGTFLAFRIDYVEGARLAKSEWVAEGHGRLLQVSFAANGAPDASIALVGMTASE